MSVSRNVTTASQSPRARVSQLDQAIWTRLREGVERDAFVAAWLTLQCRIVGGARAGAAVLGPADAGPYAPVAVWPPESDDYTELAEVTELAMTERRGVLLPVRDGERTARVAFPFVADGELHGAVALRIDQRSDRQMRIVMRHLQWGAAWIELMLRRERAERAEAGRERVAAALDMIAVALEHRGFRASCTAVATELASRLGCERAAVGFVTSRRAKVVALSHSAEIGRRMNLIRAIGQAMDEATDQGRAILCSVAAEAAEGPWVTRAHGALLRAHGADAVLSVPLTVGERTVGAVTLEHPDADGFDQARVELAESIAAVVGPILEEKRVNDRPLAVKIAASAHEQVIRLIGPGYLWRKLTLSVLVVLIAFFAWFKTNYRVNADAVLEGAVQRVVAAPFDGYLVDQSARAGDVVRAGQVLAKLDDGDLLLERIGARAEQRQREVEYAAALARLERADQKILKAQINQIEARIKLIDAQLVRTRIVAPFDGVIVAGDRSQSVGVAVTRGEELFTVVPLSGYRVVLRVDERDINEMAPGQAGLAKFASLPERQLPFFVRRITPVAEARDGANRFRVEAMLDPAGLPADRARLLPGMEGVGKVDVGRRRLIWIWTHRAFEWLRLSLWRWLP